MKLRTLVIAATLMVLSVQSAIAGNLVGYNRVDVPASTDVVFTVPFTQDAGSDYTVSTVTGSGVTVADTLNVDAFADTYYVRFTSGNGEGLWSTIDSNSASEFVLADTGILSNVSSGDTFTVFPHETLGTAFPDGLEGISFEASPNLITRRTEILVPSTTSVGINKPASDIYYYFNSEWRKSGQSPVAVFNDTVLPPQTYFILRNRGAQTLKLVTLGVVQPVTIQRILPVESQKNDVPAGTGYPVPVTLADLNLGGTPAFQTTTLLISRKDELLVFDNTATGFNKPASAIYYYYNGAWRKSGASPATSFDDEVLDPASALLIRKAAGTPGSVVWVQPSPI